MKTYREAVFESDELQRQQIREAAANEELDQERLDQINNEAKQRLHSIYLLFHPHETTSTNRL